MTADKTPERADAAPGTQENPLVLFPGPQIFSPVDTQVIMRNVLIALVPALVAGIANFGVRAALVVLTSVVSCVAFEWLWCRLRKLPSTVGDLSAAVTGVLLAFCLPSTLPYYMVVIGAFIAIVIVKELFGGIGRNFANPAIVARITLSVAFPAAMTSFVAPQTVALPDGVDSMASATVLAPNAQPADLLTLFLGTQAGSIGETSALAILIGFVFLLATRTITWHVPVVYVGGLALFAALTGHDPLRQVLSGGLLLGAVFMATDYATCPATPKGKVIFGLGLALITGFIRFWGNMNEGVAYAILLMNLLVPYLDYLCAQTPLGMEKKRRRRARASKGGASNE